MSGLTGHRRVGSPTKLPTIFEEVQPPGLGTRHEQKLARLQYRQLLAAAGWSSESDDSLSSLSADEDRKPCGHLSPGMSGRTSYRRRPGTYRKLVVN